MLRSIPPAARLARRSLAYSARPFSSSSPAPLARKKVTTLSLLAKQRKAQPITMVTAYDYPSAVHVDAAGMDLILVGDSVAMVELGMDTTQPVTMDAMIHHCQAVRRGARSPLLVGDMPFGSYEVNDEEALRNAYRFVKEAGMDAVKIEGNRPSTVRKLVSSGVAVMGHVGLTPQAISVIGGFRAQGRTAVKARQVLDDALELQEAGAFAVVLECVPAPVAKAVTEALEIPTIGIGAGSGTSGQVLVYHDMLGMTSNPHHEQFMPKFCKAYAAVGKAIHEGLGEFKKEVESGAFPSDEYSPYHMSKAEEALFGAMMAEDAAKRQQEKGEIGKKLQAQDEYEALNLYGKGD
ncbi:hypothetical protein TeGR_g6552 [Tetraparma gracilis]|uniref:3-methyl-2-oxobutanoate hydroxymethyltransferase n=1 Tax=Tetraparma gracilis TaxID=2962635 RepID=A0ABQ6M8A7_9STRA|nr:hypothetical protein TeGR_g6552 [Tetraparma gracilis]